MEDSNLRAYLPFWGDLTEEQRQALASAARVRRFPKGALLHSGDGHCTGLFLILSGALRVYTVSEEGRELTLYRLLPRELCLFSAACVFQSLQFDVSISAEQDTEALHIPPKVYERLMKSSLSVANYTNELMASRLSDVMWLMDQILNKRLDSRLAALLLEQRELEERDTLAVTHEQLGNHLGSVREVVTRMLRYFQSEGLVELHRGSITLTDPARLRILASASLR